MKGYLGKGRGICFEKILLRKTLQKKITKYLIFNDCCKK